MTGINQLHCNAAAVQNSELSVHWYAVQVRSNHERVALLNLMSREIEVFFPTYTVKHQWSDRVKQVEVALFPGYLFCRLHPNERLLVLTAPGVVRILSCGNVPVPVSEEQIESVRAVIRSKLNYGPCKPAPGLRVIVQDGPLAGITGTLMENRSQPGLLITVDTVQRGVSVDIDRQWVRPLQPC